MTAVSIGEDETARAARRRVEGLLSANLVIVALVLLGVTTVQLLIVQSVWILILLAFTASYGGTLFWARLQNRHGRLARAVLVMNIAVWPLAIVGTIVVPEALPITSLSGLGPVLLAVPELSRRAVARLLILSIVMTLAITAISMTDITHLGDRVPELTLDIAVLLSVPALVGLILVIGGQNHQLLTDRNQVLHSSRQRIAEATDRERRRIERDLHDGAQQRLHGALVQIAAARRLTSTDRAQAASLLVDARNELREAITDLHDLVNGVRPAVLDEFGLAAALRSAVARRSPPVSVAFRELGRYRPDIEAAVWFCCLEAMVNTEKHAGPMPHIDLDLEDVGRFLRFSVTDDGPGFTVSLTSPAAGGLRNMHDRVEAVGGTLAVTSSPNGSRIVGTIPLADDDRR